MSGWPVHRGRAENLLTIGIQQLPFDIPSRASGDIKEEMVASRGIEFVEVGFVARIDLARYGCPRYYRCRFLQIKQTEAVIPSGIGAGIYCDRVVTR
jgi:hypothetical protein